MFNPEDIEQLNNEIAGWNDKSDRDVLSEMDQLGIKHYKYSRNKIPLRRAYKSSLRQQRGLTNRITKSMPRSAVFLHKGVSRNHPITNPRLAKEWFNPIIDRNLDELGDIVADGQGTMIINAINIR